MVFDLLKVGYALELVSLFAEFTPSSLADETNVFPLIKFLDVCKVRIC